jgi:CHAP domain.
MTPCHVHYLTTGRLAVRLPLVVMTIGKVVNGDFQCVTFVTGAYHWANQDVPSAPNAANFWTDAAYSTSTGWAHINASGMPPLPGDIIVMGNGGVGHVAIVVDVQLPSSGRPGYVKFAQGNAVERIATEPLYKQGDGYSLNIWPGYTILGYLRHVAFYTKR